MAYSRSWTNRANGVLASSGSVTVGTPFATAGRLLVGVFVLRSSDVMNYTLVNAPTDGWEQVLWLKTNVNMIVYHKISHGDARDNLSLSWRKEDGTTVTKYWYGVVSEFTDINALTLLQGTETTTAWATTTSKTSGSLSETILTPVGQAISIIGFNGETFLNTTVNTAEFTKNYHQDYTGTANCPQVGIASTTANGTGIKTNTWNWTDSAMQNVAALITYGNSGAAPVPQWTFDKTEGVLDEKGIDGTNNKATTLTCTIGANGTVKGVQVTAASAVHAMRWFLKQKVGALLTGDIEVSMNMGEATPTWTVIPKANIPTAGNFTALSFDSTVANPQIGLKIRNVGDKVVIGNSELILNSTAIDLSLAAPIYTTDAAATEQVPTANSYGALITPTASWVDIPTNSRYYPMNEGQGLLLEETLNSNEGPANLSSASGWGTPAGWELTAQVPSRDTSFNKMAVVTALPGTPDANTIYFVTGS